MQAIADIWEPLLKAVEAEQAKSERRLWITGHSLGGALALLAAWRLRRNFIEVHQVYTFGAPMIGNEHAAQGFQREFTNKIFRYVDHMDVVPLLPTISLIANLYGHCQHEHRLGEDPAADPSTVGAQSLLKSFASRVTDGVLQLTMIDELWGQVEQRIASHMMANYQSRIADICKD
jgi:alpha-beta hydrolase superfamily lysophospholipase